MSPQLPVPVLAWVLDQALGDPPNAWHPVAWQGKLLGWSEAHAPATDRARFLWGAGTLLAGSGLSWAAGMAVERISRRLPAGADVLLVALGLKLALSARGLDRAAGQVEAALRQGDLVEARRQLSWHLVSRPTAELSAEEVGAAAIESVAENLTDAFVAPLAAWVLGGLPAVWAYRFMQTADSMWGYHDPVHEWLGKPAARLDDVLNWLPARLSATLLSLAAEWQGADAACARQTCRTQARRTASPNAGQTMATMAGALHLTLSKRGHYRLEGGTEPATPAKLGQARQILRTAAALAVGLAVLLRMGRRTA